MASPETSPTTSSNVGISVREQHGTELDTFPESSVSRFEEHSLDPTDRGKQAYLTLLACSLIQAPVWGILPILGP
jgi:hypothetical protein